MELSDREFLQFIIAFYKELLLHDYPAYGDSVKSKKFSYLECCFLEVIMSCGLNVCDVKYFEKFDCVKFILKKEGWNERLEKMNPSDEFLEWCRKNGK